MTTSVFKGGQEHRGGFRADLLNMRIAGESAKGQILQNIQVSFNQQVTMLYEIGSNFLYYVGGRARGSATIARVAGASSIAAAMMAKLCDLCSPEDITLEANAGCEDNPNNAPVHYTLQDAVLTTIALSVTAQDVVINEQLQLLFADLETDPGCG